MTTSLKKRIFLIASAMITIGLFTSCDAPTPDANASWAKIYTSTPAMVPGSLKCSAMKEGGFIVRQYDFNEDATLFKINPTGAILWQKKYNMKIINVLPVEVAGESLFICAGQDRGSADQRSCLMKIDANGQVLWKKSYGTPHPFWLHDIAISATGDSILIAGYDNGIGSAEEAGARYAKIGLDGQILWEKQFPFLNGYDPAIAPTADGGAFIWQSFSSTDHLIAKTDQDGQILWSKSYRMAGGSANLTGENQYEYWNDLEPSNDGGCVVTGFSENSAQGVVWVMKLNASGEKAWATEFSHFFSSFSSTSTVQQDVAYEPMDICATQDGGYAVLGVYNDYKYTDYLLMLHTVEKHAGWIVKLDPQGNISWQKSYEDTIKNLGPIFREVGDDYGSRFYSYTINSLTVWDLDESADGGLVFTGYVYPEIGLNTQPEEANFIVKTDREGNLSNSSLIVKKTEAENGPIDILAQDALLETSDCSSTVSELISSVTDATVTASDL